MNEKEKENKRKKGLRQLINPKYTQISVYVIATCIIIYCMSQIANHLPTLFGYISKGLSWCGAVIKPVILGFVIAYLLAPVRRFIEKTLRKIGMFRKKPSRAHTTSVILTVIFALLVVTFVISMVASALTKSFKVGDVNAMVDIINSYARELNSLYKSLSAKLESLEISPWANVTETLGSYLANFAKNLSSGVAGMVGDISGMATTLLFSVIFAVYFGLDGEMISRYWERVLRAVTTRKMNKAIHSFMDDCDEVFSGYIRGQLLDAFIMAIMVSVSLSLIGVKFAVIIGVLTGLGNLIPYVGPVVAYASTILVCVTSGDFRALIISVIVLLVIQAVDGNVINPKLLSNSINVHPLLVVLSLIVGSQIGGVLGMLLAVPVGALVKLYFERLVNRILVKRGMEAQSQQEKAPAEAEQPAAGKSGEKDV